MSFNIALTTLLDILRIVGCDDLLASIGVVHLRLLVWEETIEDPVEQAGGEEGVYVADSEAGNYFVSLVSVVQSIWDSRMTYRCWPPMETLVDDPPATWMLLTNPGSGGMQPMKKAATALQFVANLGE